MKYIPLFILIQLISLLLFIPGIIVCGIGVIFKLWVYESGVISMYHWKYKPMWLFDNENDGICAEWYQQEYPLRSVGLNIFIWSALRNSVGNLKFVPGVSKVGRPLWYWTNQKIYFKAGWINTGYPVLNAGSGKGF